MPRSRRSALSVSPAWLQVAILTFVVGFAILGYLAYRVYAEHPPVPRTTVAPDGAVLFTRDDVFQGQLLFEKYGLMEYGTIFGHGAYLGPDFTADYIERAREAMLRDYAARGVSDAAAASSRTSRPTAGTQPAMSSPIPPPRSSPFGSSGTTTAAGSVRRQSRRG